MLKNLFIVLLALLLIIGGAAYYVYANRQALTDKVVSYAVSSLTGTNQTKDAENQTWVDALVKAGFESLQTSMQTQTAQSGGASTVAKQSPQNGGGLSTMADMFANATNGNPDDLEQMAQVLLRTLGGTMGAGAMQGGYAEEPTAPVNDINARDNKGRTLLMNVCRVDVTPRVLKMMLKYGADIHAVDPEGRSALMYAVALNKNPEIVALLLKSGADIHATDNEGNTVYDYAQEPDVMAVLKNYGE
ncbi:MAG: ankyrin repeat domain-containing protein [Alphaproteobacteria bacterium]|nr:ankyrin repeat domain-containing protein [Alphaproteobacteria bacterium]